LEAAAGPAKAHAVAAGALATAAAVGVAGTALGGPFDGGGGEGMAPVMVMGAYEALRVCTTQSGISKNYPVMGLYRRSPTIKQFLSDMRPLIYVGLYTMWYPTTKRLLLLIHCDAQTEDVGAVIEERTQQLQRWAQEANLVCFEGTHLLISFFAVTGLSIWSFGLLAYLGWAIRSHAKDMTDPDVQRRFAYFVSGMEPDKAYWDVLVKKMDNLFTIVITFTSVAVDKKAKLLCYAALAGVFLVIHVQFTPFDDRKNLLCDRIEFLGLVARFFTFGLFELLLIFQPSLQVAAIAASCTLVLSGWFMFSIFTHILCEFFAEMVSNEHGGVQLKEDVFHKLHLAIDPPKSNSIVARLKRCGFACVNGILRCGVAPIKGMVLSFAKHASSVYGLLEDDALCLMPAPNFVRRIQPRATTRMTWCRRIRHNLTISFFHQSDEAQREYICGIFMGFFAHLICNQQEESLQVSEGLLGRFAVVAAALKEATLEHDVPPSCNATEKANIVRRHIYPSLSHAQKYVLFQDDKTILSQISSPKEPEDDEDAETLKDKMKLRLTGEDLNETLMLFHRLEGASIKELLDEAARAIAQVKEEAAQKVSLIPKLEEEKEEVEGAEKVAEDTEEERLYKEVLHLKSAWKTKALGIMGIAQDSLEKAVSGSHSSPKCQHVIKRHA